MTFFNIKKYKGISLYKMLWHGQSSRTVRRQQVVGPLFDLFDLFDLWVVKGMCVACAQDVALRGTPTTARRLVAAPCRPPPLPMAYDDHDRNVSHIHGFA